MRKYLIFIILFSAFSSGCASAEEQEKLKEEVMQSESVQKLSLEKAKAIAFVYEEYPEAALDISCIELSVRETDENILVSIYSKVETPQISDEILVSSGQGNQCGPHLAYTFDKEGVFESKVGVR